MSFQGDMVRHAEEWNANFPELNRFWNAATRDVEFWNAAAVVGEEHDIPPVMMIPLVQIYLNRNIKDPVVAFHSNVMKARGLMERSIRNCRQFFKERFEMAAPVSAVVGRYPVNRNSLIDTAREMSQLVVDQFRLLLSITEEIYRGSSGFDIPPSVRDKVVYRMCERNPVLLLAEARTPVYRSLAACNLVAGIRAQPWLVPVWEGIAANGGDLMTVMHDVHDDDEIRKRFCHPHWFWPLDPEKSSSDRPPVAPGGPDDPLMWWTIVQFSGPSEQLLALKAEQAIRSLPASQR